MDYFAIEYVKQHESYLSIVNKDKDYIIYTLDSLSTANHTSSNVKIKEKC